MVDLNMSRAGTERVKWYKSVYNQQKNKYEPSVEYNIIYASYLDGRPQVDVTNGNIQIRQDILRIITSDITDIKTNDFVKWDEKIYRVYSVNTDDVVSSRQFNKTHSRKTTIELIDG